MLTNNAKLRASFIETEGDAENIIRIEHSGDTYGVSDIKWVMDYVNPVGRPCPLGCLRAIDESDFKKIIDENIEFKIQIKDNKELVLNYINQPE
jgi:hypothetical protein